MQGDSIHQRHSSRLVLIENEIIKELAQKERCLLAEEEELIRSIAMSCFSLTCMSSTSRAAKQTLDGMREMREMHCDVQYTEDKNAKVDILLWLR